MSSRSESSSRELAELLRFELRLLLLWSLELRERELLPLLPALREPDDGLLEFDERFELLRPLEFFRGMISSPSPVAWSTGHASNGRAAAAHSTNARRSIARGEGGNPRPARTVLRREVRRPRTQTRRVEESNMQIFHRNERGERGGLRAAAVLWLLGLPAVAALLLGYLVCR